MILHSDFDPIGPVDYFPRDVGATVSIHSRHSFVLNFKFGSWHTFPFLIAFEETCIRDYKPPAFHSQMPSCNLCREKNCFAVLRQATARFRSRKSTSKRCKGLRQDVLFSMYHSAPFLALLVFIFTT